VKAMVGGAAEHVPVKEVEARLWNWPGLGREPCLCLALPEKLHAERRLLLFNSLPPRAEPMVRVRSGAPRQSVPRWVPELWPVVFLAWPNASPPRPFSERDRA